MFVVVLFLSLHFFFVSLDGMFRKGGLDGVRVLNKKKVEMFSKTGTNCSMFFLACI